MGILLVLSVLVVLFLIFMIFLNFNQNENFSLELFEIPGNELKIKENLTEHKRGRSIIRVRRPAWRTRIWAPRRGRRVIYYHPQPFSYYYSYPYYQYNTQPVLVQQNVVKFCVYRDPIDRFVYLYQKSIPNSEPAPTKKSLNKFIDNFLKNPQNYPLFQQKQSQYMKDCSFILRYENIDKDMTRFSKSVKGDKISLETPQYESIRITVDSSDIDPKLSKKLKDYYFEDYQIKTTWND